MSISERKHVSEGEAPARVEIFTGAGRRRRWSAERKAAIVAESFEETWPRWSKSASSTVSILRSISRALAKMVQR